MTKSLLLPQGTTITTRIFSTHSVPEAFDLSFWRESKIPNKLHGPDGYRELVSGIIFRRLQETIEYDGYPPVSGVTLKTSRVEVSMLVDVVITVEWLTTWIVPDGRSVFLDADHLRIHWVSFYELWCAFEQRLLADTELDGQNSTWQFPLTLIHPSQPHDIHEEMLQAMFVNSLEVINEDSLGVLRTKKLSGVANWNGCLIWVKEPSVDVSTIQFLIRLVCVDWHAHEIANAQLKKIVLSAMNSEALLSETRNIFRQFYRTLSVLEPHSIAYEEEDVMIVETLWKGWRREDFNRRLRVNMDRTLQLYAFALDGERRKAQANQQRQQDVLNKGVAWLAVAGIGGTAAGILSTIDFNNASIGFLMRISIIGGSMILTVLAFIYLLYQANKAGDESS